MGKTYKLKDNMTGQILEVPEEQLGSYGVTLPTQQAQLPPMPQTPAPQVSSSARLPPMPEQKSIEGFAGNIGKSAVQNAKAIGSGVLNILNPDLNNNTIVNLGKTAVGTGELLIPGEQGLEKYPRAIGQVYDKRYGFSNIAKGDFKGAANKIGETAYNDPVGVALDASTVLEGSGALLKGTGAISKSSKLARAGEIVSNAGRAIDPVAQTTKLIGKATGAVSDKIASSTEGMRDSSSSFLAKKSIKANASQLEKFKDLTGQDLGQFMTDNGVYTLDDAEKAIKPLQSTYDKMVRTGQKVSGASFADNLRQKGLDILQTDISPSARQVAEKLWSEADQVEKIGDVTDTILTNSKTSSFGKVSAKAMTDPITDNFNKIYGEVGIQTLDTVAPGSSKIGKQLQAYRQFQEVAKRQGELGKGAQVINLLKPGVGGAVIGNIIPGIGPVAGAVAGEVMTNPIAQRTAAKVLQNGLPGGGVVNTVGNTAMNVGRASRALPVNGVENQPLNQSPQTPNQLPPISLGQTSQDSQKLSQLQDQSGQPVSYDNNTTPTANLPPIEPPSYITGNSPQEHAQAYSAALMAGDTKSAAQIKSLYDMETEYQKSNKPKEQKPLTGANSKDLNKAETAVRSLNRVESLLSSDPKAMMKKLNPLDQTGRQLGYDITSAIDILGYFRTGATITPQQRQDYINLFPTILDDEKTRKFKIDNLKREFEGYKQGLLQAGPDIMIPEIQQSDASLPPMP